MIWAGLQWFLEGHKDLTALDYLLNTLFAVLGASVAVFANNPRVRMPRWVEGEWEPGALGYYVIGVSCALAIGHRVPVPFLVGMLAPVVIPFLLKSTVPSLLRLLNPMLVAALESATGRKEDKE